MCAPLGLFANLFANPSGFEMRRDYKLQPHQFHRLDSAYCSTWTAEIDADREHSADQVRQYWIAFVPLEQVRLVCDVDGGDRIVVLLNMWGRPWKVNESENVSEGVEMAFVPAIGLQI